MASWSARSSAANSPRPKRTAETTSPGRSRGILEHKRKPSGCYREHLLRNGNVHPAELHNGRYGQEGIDHLFDLGEILFLVSLRIVLLVPEADGKELGGLGLHFQRDQVEESPAVLQN